MQFATQTRVDGDHTHSWSESMRAITQCAYGSADVFRYGKVDLPTIKNDEVLIDVHAAGLDRGTWHLMTGEPYLIRLGFGLIRPKQKIPGLDVAGRVHAIGSDVTRFSVGDAVYGIANGSFAEYAAAKEEKLVLKPANVSFESAAVATVSGITALQALTDRGKVQTNDRVLVIGASGGVGTYAVQIAKALGAEVAGVSSESKADMVRSLGADSVFDYQTSYLKRLKRHFDLVIDIGGRNKISDLRRVMKSTGTLVFVGGEGGNRVTGGIGRQIRGALMSPFLKQNLKMFISSEKRSTIERLNELIKSDQITPQIDRQFALEDVSSAMREMESGNVRGKNVIVVRR